VKGISGCAGLGKGVGGGRLKALGRIRPILHDATGVFQINAILYQVILK